MRTIIYILALAIIIIAIQFIGILPWWGYLVVTTILGAVISLENIKVNSFFCGFWAGALAWIGATVFFQYTHEGDMMNKFAAVFEISTEVLMLMIGAMGGLLTGLSIHSGAVFRRGRENPELIIHD